VEEILPKFPKLGDEVFQETFDFSSLWWLLSLLFFLPKG
jgi:hypothetical protein